MEIKKIKSQDDIYNYHEVVMKSIGTKNEGQVVYGADCLYRSLYVQGKTDLDINFGLVMMKKSLLDPEVLKEQQFICRGDYFLPYGWHVWNENDGEIYDSPSAMNVFMDSNVDFSKLTVGVMDLPHFGSQIRFERKVLPSIVNRFRLKKGPDVIYLAGNALQENGQVMTWDVMNGLLDETDEAMNLTGTTENNVVNVLVD